MEAKTLNWMPFLRKLSFQVSDGLGNGRYRVAHGSIQPTERVVTEGYREHALCARPIHIKRGCNHGRIVSIAELEQALLTDTLRFVLPSTLTGHTTASNGATTCFSQTSTLL